jgi:hypothetical protein
MMSRHSRIASAYSWLLAAGIGCALLSGSGCVRAMGPAAPALQATAGPPPRLVADGSVAGDLQQVADQTWSRFMEVFQARAACFGDVRLHASRDLASRGAYDPESATVTVRVPATAVMLQSALVHEWAHHIEYQCPAQQELRSAFIAAQGLPPELPWRPSERQVDLPASAWAGIPAEQYAEATIEVVLGRRQIPTGAQVRTEAVDVIARWAAGR